MKITGSRRSFLKSSVAASAGVAAFARGETNTSVPANIIYLHSHDSGRYLRPYGHDVPTPNLLRLAKSGVLFRQMHCAAPSCSPSRAALLTGQTSHQSGMLGLAHLGWGLHEYKQHILHTLRGKGYHSALAGLQHIAVDPTVIGFDQILPGESKRAADVAPRAAAFLKSRPKGPFFLDCGFFETHREFPAPTDNADYILPPAPLPDNSTTRYDMAGFHESARALDKAIGIILDTLEQTQLASNTLIISTTDHGIAFPWMKCDLRDMGTGVSFIMRGPGVFSRPRVCDALLSQVDVFPTLCDYLKIDKPAWLTGKSFLPILEDKVEEINDAVFAEITYHAAYEPKRSVRTKQYKYIRRYDDRTTWVLPNCDDGPSKSFLLKNGWKSKHLLEREELYDLLFDPYEHSNLAGRADYGSVLTEMRSRLDMWMVRTNDPLLKGPVPLAPHGRTAPVDADSPKAIVPPLAAAPF